VSNVIFLDSGPLGLITHPQRTAEVIAVTEWLARCILGGSRVFVPAIVYYELTRELLRANKTSSIRRLDAFVNVSPDRYVPLSDPALRLAAELWAKARQQGQQTADAKVIDIDVILAAQALSFGAPSSELVVATTNPRHLARFTTARHWNQILT
jgi:predicted nucleic acid-binding protein